MVFEIQFAVGIGISVAVCALEKIIIPDVYFFGAQVVLQPES